MPVFVARPHRRERLDRRECHRAAGVTIGDNAVIGANSLVTKDIPANTVAYGSPCKVIREINERDDVYYWRDRQFSERFKLKEQ